MHNTKEILFTLELGFNGTRIDNRRSIFGKPFPDLGLESYNRAVERINMCGSIFCFKGNVISNKRSVTSACFDKVMKLVI